MSEARCPRLRPEVGDGIKPTLEILQPHRVWVARHQIRRALRRKLTRKLAKTAAGGVSA